VVFVLLSNLWWSCVTHEQMIWQVMWLLSMLI